MEYTTPLTVYGQLFLDMNASGIWEDDKIIADLIPLKNPAEILREYLETKDVYGFSLKEFVNENFEYNPASSNYISDSDRPIEEHLRLLWSHLKREADQEIEGSSLIPLPYPYIVPGGRFNEIYYWDSYFTMLGLGVSGEIEMIENMVKNFSYLIDQVGFIPNGNRTYFMSRSQPPFFSLMVELLANYRGESTYLKFLPQMRAEYQFWMAGEEIIQENHAASFRVVRINDHFLNRYYDDDPTPRAEMYATDVEDATEYPGVKEQYFLEVKAACESGWDFSSRWLADGKSLATIQTTKILPIDLNCLLYHLEKTIAFAHNIAGDQTEQAHFEQRASTRKAIIQNLFWNKKCSFYQDYNWQEGEGTTQLSAAGIFPLFLKVATEDQAKSMISVLKEKLIQAGGVVSTPHHTGQQWDAPNGWAPLQWVAIEGLRNYGYRELAEEIAKRWMKLNEKVYKNTGKMMEKYNVENLELLSGGGEYPVQDGFGWSNGVYLKLRDSYPF